jgi:hypothetical protein
MKMIRCCVLLPLFLFGLTQACANDLQLTVLYDQVQGLKPGDEVYMDGKPIGAVQSIEVNKDGQYEVQLGIKDEFRPIVTDQCHFYIRSNPHRSEHQALEIIAMAEGGSPLPDGAVVEGGSYLAYLLERGSRDLQAWSGRLQVEIERWAEGLSDLPKKEWYGQLERQMEAWAAELERAGEDARRHFRDEILPKLEEALEELRRRLEEEDEEEELEPLEIKLKRLKRV